MKRNPMLEIIEVEPGSIADELELEPGDRLVSINGQTLRDILDYEILAAGEEILLEVLKKNGELWDVEFDKDAEDSLGLLFDPPQPAQCGNNCIFCFVHQLPRGLRKTLYVKDEDFRFSYLYGTYVTLSNISEKEIERIIEQKISPLYVSVHATDEQLRDRMLGRKCPPVLELLQRLSQAGIEMHTQIVVCPGVNDGEQLEKTILDLYSMHPQVKSLAVVPVGLTGFRERLPQLRPPTRDEARSTLELIHALQKRFCQEAATHFVFAADEYYLKAEESFPPLESYEELPQYENGVGMIPLFRQEAQEVLAVLPKLGVKDISLVTGLSAAAEVTRFAEDFGQKAGVNLMVYPVENRFFGGHVSVTGLLSGQDILEQLKGQPLGEALLIPDVMLKEGENIFLDDTHLDDLQKQLGVPVISIASSPWGLYHALALFDAEMG